MNKSAFLELIQQASSISDQQTEELEKVAAAFPYCQTAHLLLAKSAHDKGSMLSTQRLRRASAYATNRQVLKRVIYTSPTPAPVFGEPVVEESDSAVPELAASHAASLPETHQEAVLTVAEPEAIEADTSALPNTADEVAEAEAIPSETESPVTYSADETTSADGAETADEVETAATQVTAHTSADAAPEEEMHSELEQLMTISSLSTTFTDLLAQKADLETETSVTASTSIPHTPTEEEPVLETGAAPTQEPDLPERDMQGVLMLRDAFSSVPSLSQTEKEPIQEETEAPASAEPSKPAEIATITYLLSEIDQMYADDALGYWMASSRMGEALQLKDKITRERPAAFHPEMILEYVKTHELQKNHQEAPAVSLHQQSSIIDQFLKLNPRLKAMNSLKMKQEPQEDLSLRNSKIKKGIASESLANIFLKQGKVKKAIKIYEQLILKYPEKKSYFAGEIEKLHKLT